MPEFTVSWEIQLEAESHQDAARKAQEIQRDPCADAACFDVFGTDVAKRVNLNDPDGV